MYFRKLYIEEEKSRINQLQDLGKVSIFNLCMLGNFSCFSCRLLTFFQNLLFQKILSGILSECQTVWIQIRTDSVGPDLGSDCLQRLSADNKSHC